MSQQDDLKLLGALAREQEQSEREEEARLLEDAKRALTEAQIERFTDAAVPMAKVVPLKRRAPGIVVLAAAAAIAAGVAIYVQSRPPEAVSPRYAMVVTGGDQPLRGDAGPSTAISRGARITIELRPERAVSTAVQAAAFLLHGDGGRTISAPSTVADSGAVRIEGTRDELFGDAIGAHDLVVFVGPHDALPRDVGSARAARGANDPRLSVSAMTLTLLE